MAKKKSASEEAVQTPVQRKAIIFELEHMAVNGREVFYEVFQEVLKSRDVELTPRLFALFCSHPSIRHFLVSLPVKDKEKTNLADHKVIESISQKLAAAFSSVRVKLDPGLSRLLKAMESESVAVGALSALDEATARELTAQLGLTDRIVLLSEPDSVKVFPGPDAWLKMAKRLTLPPAQCLALSTSAPSSHAALSVGMRCVAVPDAYTAFQDFGGVDGVADTIDEAAVETILALLRDTGRSL